MVVKQPSHLVRRFQIPLRIRLQREPRLVDATAKADAGHHVLQRTAIRQVIKNVVGRHHRQRQRRHRPQTLRIIGAVTTTGCKIRRPKKSACSC